MRIHLHTVDGEIIITDAGEFIETKHPRVKGGSHGGEFTSKGGGAGSSSGGSQAAKHPKLTVTKVATRAYTGEAKEIKTKITRQETGRLGESVVMAHLNAIGVKEVRPLNMHMSNFPVDLIGDHMLVEAKAGLVSNGPSAQHWRSTIGEPTLSEAKLIKKLSREQLAKRNARKAAQIMERKEKVLREMSAKLGRPLKAVTVATIIDPDTGVADVYMFRGFHLRIGWNTPEAKKGYVGSYKFKG